MRHDQLVMQAMNRLAEARELLDQLVEQSEHPVDEIIQARETTREALTRVSVYFTELILENLKKEKNHGIV